MAEEGAPRFVLVPFDEITAGTTPPRWSREDLRPFIERARVLSINGVECRDGFYAIEVSRIWEEEFGAQPYGWVRHMAMKDWIDLPDFVEALRFARSLARAQEQLGYMRKPFFQWKNLPSCPDEALAGAV